MRAFTFTIVRHLLNSHRCATKSACSSVSLLMIIVCCGCASIDSESTSVAIPQFGIIGQYDTSTDLVLSGNATAHPKQLVVDFNRKGIIYGFTCDYDWNLTLFKQLVDGIGRSIDGQLASNDPMYFIWRDEAKRITVSLFVVEDEHVIRIVAVSIDPSVRQVR